ncbi:unnamed protein product [Rodentolepis nana]|uniref:Protein krueppel n=1 Tax=Rodentolepis nana TaxID=102285 RepID=A0A0R3TCS2_RODNA|nr:unnamed protein product [Rodentolepis nana]
MDLLLTNPRFNTNNLMPQGLIDVLKSGFNLNDLPYDLLTEKQESSSSSSPENNASSPSTPPTFPSMPVASSEVPYDETTANTDALKDKLRHVLRDIIPHKSTLQIQVLVAYTVDDSKKDVISINETYHQTKHDQTTTTVANNVLDLSQKSDEESSKSSVSGNELGDLLSAPSVSIGNLFPNHSAPLGLPSQTSNPLHLNQDSMIQLLRAFLTSTNTPIVNPLQSTVNPFNFSLPINLPPLPTSTTNSMDMKTFTEVAPNVTITNCDSIPSNTQVGCPNKTTNTNDSGSRGSSPLSNEGSYTSPLSTSRPLTKVPSQALFSRRYVHPRRFICNQCRDQFSSLTELTRHTLEVHNSFRCNYCNAKFTQRSNLQRHSLKHVGFKPFTCNICNKEYYRKDHLVRHIEVTHPDVDPRLNITTRLSSSECLEFLDNLHLIGNSDLRFEDGNNSARSSLNGTNQGSVNSPAKSDEGLIMPSEGPPLTPVAQEGTDYSIDPTVEQSSFQPMEN